jgi:hypothetical protein
LGFNEVSQLAPGLCPLTLVSLWRNYVKCVKLVMSSTRRCKALAERWVDYILLRLAMLVTQHTEFDDLLNGAGNDFEIMTFTLLKGCEEGGPKLTDGHARVSCRSGTGSGREWVAPSQRAVGVPLNFDFDGLLERKRSQHQMSNVPRAEQINTINGQFCGAADRCIFSDLTRSACRIAVAFLCCGCNLRGLHEAVRNLLGAHLYLGGGFGAMFDYLNQRFLDKANGSYDAVNLQQTYHGGRKSCPSPNGRHTNIQIMPGVFSRKMAQCAMMPIW